MSSSKKTENFARRSEDPVREVLLEKGLWQVHTVLPGASVLEALALLEENDIGALIVTEGDTVAGMISERDCARQVLLEGKDPGLTTVGSVMHRGACSVTAHKKVSECIDLMLRRHIRHLPVFFGRYLVGCVSLRNLLEYMYQLLPEKTPAASDRKPRYTGRKD